MKKQTSYFNRKLLLISIIFLFIISCTKKENKQEPTTPTPSTPTPSIISMTPRTGTVDTELTITGENFGNNSGDVKVTFDSKNANITSFSPQSIKVKAPTGFSDAWVSVRVSVVNETSNKMDFFYINTTPPLIKTMSTSCFYNSTVVITGENFSSIKEDNIVKFGTVSGTVVAATSTSLKVKTPNLGDFTTVSVTVNSSGRPSNAKSIDVDLDQNKIATYDWLSTTTKPGIIYKTGQFSLFGEVQRRIYILDASLNTSNTMGIGFSTTNASTTAMCTNYNAVAGINAGYFPFGGASDKDPYIRIDGNEVQSGHLNVSQIFTNSALIINNNVATIRKFTETHKNLNQVAAAISVVEANNIIVCGPMLITSDKIEDLDMGASHNYSQTSRTGLGVTADGKRVFMVVVDTGGGVTGVTTLQLAKILQALGAVNAMNLDGGGSSTMFVEGQGASGRVNFPSGGTYQRPVRSVIYIK